MSTALGPFEVGQAPLLTATIVPLSGGVSTACTWIIRTPSRVVTEVSSGETGVANPADNVWTYQMPAIVEDGIYWVRCQSTAGVLASKTSDLGVVEDIFDTED